MSKLYNRKDPIATAQALEEQETLFLREHRRFINRLIDDVLSGEGTFPEHMIDDLEEHLVVSNKFLGEDLRPLCRAWIRENANKYTHKNTQWGIGVIHHVESEKPSHSNGIHVYQDPHK